MAEHRAPTPERLPWLTPARRKWLYVVLTAAVPLLITYGVLTETTAPLWLSLAAAVLGTGTAAAHTPQEGPDDANP